MQKILLVLLVSAILFFGCTGQQPPTTSTGGQNNAPIPTAPAPQQNAPVQAKPAPAPVAPTPQPTTNDDSTEFSQLAALGEKTNYKITYDISFKDTKGNIITGQQIVYSKGTLFRMDSLAYGAQTRMLKIASGMYFCSNYGSWTCNKLPSNTPGQTSTAVSASDVSKYKKIVSDGTMSVAGTTAKCFQLTLTDVPSMRYCVSNEGVPLYIKLLENSAQSEMTASSYSTQVADSDFELPAQPK